MFRMFIGSVIFGILACLIVYFASHFVISESDIVSFFAGYALEFSNLNFDTMPGLLASYIANLDLLAVALTIGLLATVVIQLLVMVGAVIICISKWIISLLKKDRTVDEAPDMSPLDMNSKFKSSAKDEKVLGRGLDSIDRD